MDVDYSARKTNVDTSVSDLAGCSKLFSEHYGVYNEKNRRSGKRVRLGANRLKDGYLFDENCFLVTATDNKSKEIVGHAFSRRFFYSVIDGNNTSTNNSGDVIWITQLVVHSNWRIRGIARELLKRSTSPNDIGYAIVTCHPYAVRAFETVIGHTVSPTIVKQSHPQALINASGIPYLAEKFIKIDDYTSIIDTNFQVDHKEILCILDETPDWKLGRVRDGEEYLVVIFTDATEKKIGESGRRRYGRRYVKMAR